MPMMFFYFLKIIFDISTSKRSKKYKPHSILVKKKIQIWRKRRYKRSTKRSLNWLADLTCLLLMDGPIRKWFVFFKGKSIMG